MSRVYKITDDDGRTTKAYALREAGRFTGHGVYELLSHDFEVIYIGRTGHLAERLMSHRATKLWWRSVQCFRWTACANYAEAVALENIAIASTPGVTNEKNVIDHFDTPSSMSLPSAAAHRLRGLYAAVSLDPAPFDSYALALRDAGWTLQAIAEPLGITRERIRQRLPRAARDYDLFAPKAPSLKPWRKPKPSLGPAELRRIAELHPLATQCRGTHGEGHPYRVASVELSELLANAQLRGVSRKEMASAMGLTVDAITQRLKIHGYHKVAPSQTPFGTAHPIFTQATRTECRRGHPLSGDNVRLINGDPKRRVCRACDRIRVAAYQARGAVA